MRRPLSLALLLLSLASCRGEDVLPPTLRRPLEDLPRGAHVVALGADLGNTWERARGHEVEALLRGRTALGSLLDRPEIAPWRSVFGAGTKLGDELVLDLVGERAALGIYPRGPSLAANDCDLVLVSEMEDAERFGAAIDSLQKAGTGIGVRRTTLDGRAALRLEPATGRALVVVQEDRFLVAASADSLVRAALAVHAGEVPGALQDSTLQAALGALGAHNLVVLARATAAAPWSWVAQGFTWDPSGLRFDLVQSGVPGTVAVAASRRTDILRSIPDGMALAGYARTGELKALWMPRADSLPAPRGPAFSLPFLPAELWGFAGDEIGIALAGVAPSALAPLPDVGLVLTLRDSAGAERMLRTVEAAVGAVRLQGRGYSFEEVAYGGRTFRSLVQPISESLTPSWFVDGDLAILTTTRALMQQFVDTRRTGRRHALSDASFRRFDTFVPPAASMAFYGDPRRLHRALEQLGPGLGRWNADVARRVREIEEFVALCGHFPAGAVYATRDGERLELRSWVVEPGR